MSAPAADDEVGRTSAVSSEAGGAAEKKDGRGKGRASVKDRTAAEEEAGSGGEEGGGSNSGGDDSSDGDGESSDGEEVRGFFSRLLCAACLFSHHRPKLVCVRLRS